MASASCGSRPSSARKYESIALLKSATSSRGTMPQSALTCVVLRSFEQVGWCAIFSMQQTTPFNTKTVGHPGTKILVKVLGGSSSSRIDGARRFFEMPLHGGCPGTQRSRRWTCLVQRKGSFWLVGLENTATYILSSACAIWLPRQMTV